MAQKRMFDKRVVCSDKFTDLPNSSKALYFMAGMEADDKGFFQPRRLQKLCGFTDDDFKILIAKRFFIPFDSGVMVVTDWNRNNWLDSRRITETDYTDELKMLQLINEKYELLDNKVDIQVDVAKQMLRENSIEQNRIDKNNIYIVGDNYADLTKEIVNYLNEKVGSNYKFTTKKTKTLIKARMNEGFKLEDFKKVIDIKTDEWLKTDMQKYLRPETLFGTKFEGYLNQVSNNNVPSWFGKEIEKDEEDEKYEKLAEQYTRGYLET